jgi:hypothetical protein
LMMIVTSSLAFAGEGNRPEFRATYLQDAPETLRPENSYFTVVGSFSSEGAATDFINKTLATNPDIDLDLYVPYQNNPLWAVMIASNTSAENSMKACLVAKKRSISKRPYLWTNTRKTTYC